MSCYFSAGYGCFHPICIIKRRLTVVTGRVGHIWKIIEVCALHFKKTAFFIFSDQENVILGGNQTNVNSRVIKTRKRFALEVLKIDDATMLGIPVMAENQGDTGILRDPPKGRKPERAKGGLELSKPAKRAKKSAKKPPADSESSDVFVGS